MYILQIGFNHLTTPVEIREKFIFNEEKLNEANVDLINRKSILENVILSTCNRTEIYAVVDQIHTGRYYIKQFLQDWFSIPMESFEAYLVIKEDKEAVEHLFQVAAGLQSMVLGETQILGQVKDAFFIAQKEQTTGTIFNELFKRVITFAKRAHHETAIGEFAVSISYAAVQLAKKICGNIENKHVVIYGAGEMGELAVKNLIGAGVKNITVVNRTFSRAEQLANTFNAKALSIDELEDALLSADIFISSTSAKGTILTKDDMALIQKKRRSKPLFIFDVAVPRDLDASIRELDGMFLYDIDDLQHIVDENKAERERIAKEILRYLNGEIDEFYEWIVTLGVVPIIHALREKALKIQSETYNSILRKIPDLNEREKKVISKHTKSIINQMIRKPIIQAKEMAARENREELLSIFIGIFGIEDSIKKDVTKRAIPMKNISRKKVQRNTTVIDSYIEL